MVLTGGLSDLLNRRQNTLHDTPLHLQRASTGRFNIIARTAGIPRGQLIRIGREVAARIRWRNQGPERPFRWYPDCGLELSSLNERPALINGPQLLHQLFELHASKETVALEYLDHDGTTWSYPYQTLNKASENLARKIGQAMRQRGEQRPSRSIIPILMAPSPNLYVAILAVLKAGAAFCPLDLEAPPDRLKFILEDLSARIVLADQASADIVTWKDGPDLLVVTSDGKSDEETSDGQSKADLGPTDLAYILYTSGSTGTPKGVAVSHLAVTQSLLAHDAQIPCFKRFLQFAAPTFDVSIFEIFFPFYRGSTLISCNRRDLLNDLPSVVNRLDVDAAVLTPTVAGGLLQKRRHVPGLKVLMTIGEMLTRPLIAEFGGSTQQPGILYAMYGPTEASIHCTIAVRLRNDSKVGIIGVPLETVSAYIIAPSSESARSDSRPEILPVGHVGELALGGHQLASGYLNRVRHTEEAFLTSTDLGRIYRTGDRARLLPNGMLECLGRLVDGQVKVRGHRLELGEIERIAMGIPMIRSAIASVLGGVLVVFCMPENAQVQTERIRERFQAWLPQALVPGDVLLLEDMPRLASGKVNKQALHSIYRSKLVQDHTTNSEDDRTAHAPEMKPNDPSSAEERSVRTVLARLTDFAEEKISSRSTIFQLGLDSISAVQVAAGLRERGWRVFAADVLQNVSVSELASFLRKSGKDESPTLSTFDFSAFDKIHRASTTSRFLVPDSVLSKVRPCTPVQEGMIAKYLGSDGELYLAHYTFRLENENQPSRMREAWETVAKKYAMLRTGFSSLSDQRHPFAMLEYNPGALSVPWRLTPSSTEELTQIIDRQKELARKEILQQLHKPTWRLAMTIQNHRALLHLSILHALFDAQSLRQILFDVRESYSGRSLVPEVSIEPVVGFILSSCKDVTGTQEQFWQSLKESMCVTEFPNMSPTRSTARTSGFHSKMCSRTLVELERGCSRQGVTISAVGQAAWARILAAHLGQDVVTFGVVFSARTIVEEAQGSVFPCLATQPVGCRVDSTSIDLVRSVMSTNSRILRHHLAPLARVQKSVQREHRPMFNTIFAFQKFSPEVVPDNQQWEKVDELVNVDVGDKWP